MHFQDHLEARSTHLKCSSGALLIQWHQTQPRGWLCAGQMDTRTPRPATTAILASAQTWARPHLFPPAPQGPPAICISHPLAHTSASNSSDYAADSRALLCPCPGHMAEAGREGRTGQDPAGSGRIRQDQAGGQHSPQCMRRGQWLQHQLPQELSGVSTAPAHPCSNPFLVPCALLVLLGCAQSTEGGSAEAPVEGGGELLQPFFNYYFPAVSHDSSREQ